MRYLRVVGLLAAACLALPAAAGAFVAKAPNGHRLSVMLRAGIKGPGKGGGGSRTSDVLLPHSGPVLKAEAPYLIYWDPSGSIDASNTGLLNQYLTDVAAASQAGDQTNVYSVLEQYGSPYSQTFGSGQVIYDTNPYPTKGSCPLATGLTACVTDASIQAEIAKVIPAAELSNSQLDYGIGTTPIFFVITPVNTNVCISGNTCSSNNFCAYHSYFGHNGNSVLYASVPFSVFANGNTKGCQTDGIISGYNTPVGPSGPEAYNIADDLSHELSETITDPLINAWYSKQGLEVGDLCEAYGTTANPSKGLSLFAYGPAYAPPPYNYPTKVQGYLYDQIINGNLYYNQTEYSNKPAGCEAGVNPFTPLS